MAERRHEYSGLAVEVYDRHGPRYDDETYFRRRIEEAGGAALEVMCGTGRLLVPFLMAGLDVEGMDASPEMLAVCRRKAEQAGVRAVLYEQYVQDMDLPRRYRTLFVAVASFMLLEDLEEAKEALRRFHVHLEEGGQLFVTLYIPHEEIESNNAWYLVRHVKRPEDGAMILVSAAARAYRDRQVLKTATKYELFDGDGLLARTELQNGALRWYEQGQFEDMLQEAGFRDVLCTGDVSDEPFGAGHRTMMFRAVK